MNWDTTWQVIRYVLIAASSFVVGKGWVTTEQAEIIIGAIGAIGAIIWGIYVRFGTKSVLQKTGDRVDVPTVSGATGAIQ